MKTITKENIMKRASNTGIYVLLFLLGVGSILSAGAGNGSAADKKEVTVKGEVLDLFCYLDHGAKGGDHAKCAETCLNKGIPAGFLGSDGVFYLLLGDNHNSANEKVAAFAGKASEISGTLVEQNGVKAIMVKSIKAA